MNQTLAKARLVMQAQRAEKKAREARNLVVFWRNRAQRAERLLDGIIKATDKAVEHLSIQGKPIQNRHLTKSPN
jgi:hypothetical protein